MSNQVNKSLVMAFMFFGAIAILYFHASYYYPFIADDALISLRYAYRLIDGKGLTWTEGQPVEGYSNLLWVLLNAFLYRLGVDLIDSSRILGLAGMSIVILSLLKYWYLFKNSICENYAPLAIGLFFFCMAAPIAVWTIGGLEQPLYAGLIAVSIPLTIQIIEPDKSKKNTIYWLSFVLGLICITRPDGPLFFLASFLSIYIGRLVSGRNTLSISDSSVLALFPVLFYGGQLIFRLYYYGEVVPNTALVKITPSLHHFIIGAKYVQTGLWALFPFSLFAVISIIALILLPHKRSRAIPLLMINALWIPYIIFVGGDVFPAYRHFIPVIVAFAFSLVEGGEVAMIEINRISIRYKSFFLGSIFISFMIFILFQFADTGNKRAISERWEWDGKVVGLLLNQAFSKQLPLLAVTAAGCLPYWSRLPALDMLGLNDYYLPRHPPEGLGKGLLGHELGDGKYVLSKRPDIIVFRTGALGEAYFRSGREIMQLADFYTLYTPVKVLGKYPYSYIATIWFYKYSPKIGIHKTTTEIRVPGFLLNGMNTIAYLNGTGRFVMSIPSGQSASIVIDSAVGQNWTIKVRGSHSEEIRSELQQMDTSLEVRLFSESHNLIEIEEFVLIKNE